MQGFSEVQELKKTHALERLLERFGITLSDEEYNRIVYEIEEYIIKPIYINSKDGKSFHIFNVRGNKCVFLYDWEYKCLLTVYYKSWFKKNKNGTWTRKMFHPKAKQVREKNRSDTMSSRPLSNSFVDDYNF